MKKSFRINKELYQAFKELTLEVYDLKYTKFIEGYLLYSRLVDLKKIFKFRYDIKYQDYVPIGEDKKIINIEQITFNNYELINSKLILNKFDFSTYIREFITLFVVHNKEFTSLFKLYIPNYYENDDDYNYFLELVTQDIKSVTEFNQYTTKNLKLLHQNIEIIRNTLGENMLNIVYIDFEYENSLVKNYRQRNITYNELEENERFQIELSKRDNKDTDHIKIMLLQIKLIKLILIYLYRTITCKRTQINDFYKEYKKNILKEYKTYNLEFKKVPISEYILLVVHNDNELLRFIHTNTIKASNLQQKNIKLQKEGIRLHG